MNRLLIVDDEPLVQIGLKSMLSQDFPDIRVAGTAQNGKDALKLIGEEKPDIVIADIKMPVMTGLQLLQESQRLYGPVPVFIILTAYEEFDLARQALKNQAVDYLVKIELNRDTLRKALDKAIRRVREHVSLQEAQPAEHTSLEEFRQKFMLRLFDRCFPDEETLKKQAQDLMLSFEADRYIVVYCQISPEDAAENSRRLILYSSCLNMARQIVERYVPCYTVSNDIRHFSLIFYFTSDEAVAEIMAHIEEAIENARSMIMSYFNVPLRFGIGTAVAAPMDISASFEEARAAEAETTCDSPVLLFSHIVGANRRSGKDKLISSIQEYINENLNGKLQLNEVAEVFGLSPAYLSALFKKSTDIGFSEYVYTRKIEKAKQMLLSGDMKIYEVADAMGFESAFYFSKVFKKVDGHSPREYIQSKSAE